MIGAKFPNLSVLFVSKYFPRFFFFFLIYFLRFFQGFILFSIGLLLVLRAHEHELFVFTLILLIPMVTISIMLIIHLIEKRARIDLSDFFLLVIVILLISIIGNIFLYIQSLKNLQTHIRQKHNPLQPQPHQQQKKKTSIYFPQRKTDTFEL